MGPALLAALALRAGALAAVTDAEALRALEQSAIQLAPEKDGAPLSPGLAVELLAGLRRLPEPMRSFPGGPLRFVEHASAAAFGLGDGSERPDWSDGRRTFHLYRYAPSQERRAESWLGELDEVERERLWRQRAIVHAVVQRWDDALGLSKRLAWRRISGWPGPVERVLSLSGRPLNRYAGAYSRQRGQQSASLDLVTYAEEHFVPAEALRAGAVSGDDSVRCQELTRARVLDTLLAEAGLGPGPTTPRCLGFERWAELDGLEQLEVLFVIASGRRPQSLFGHVLLRPVHRPGGLVRGPGFATMVEIAAITDGPIAGPAQLARGIFGGYTTTVSTLAASDLEREALHLEQRTIRRFRLNLSPDERRRTLERVWELERRGYFDYRFFTENCASVLVFLLEAALPETVRIEVPGPLLVAPTTVLDGLTDAKIAAMGTGEQTPLLSYVPLDLESSRDLAVRSERRRGEVEARLLTTATGETRLELQRAFEWARSPEPSLRRQAWEQLAPMSERLVESGPELGALYDWWALTVRIERYAWDLADAERLDLETRTILPDGLPPLEVEAELAARQQLFERESRLAHARMILDRREELAIRLRGAPRRQSTPGELEEKARAEATMAGFERLTDLHGALVAGIFADRDPHAWLEQDSAALRASLEAASADSLGPSGAWRAAAGAGARASADGSVVPVITLWSAALSERLGEQRLRGIRASAELRILEAEVELRPVLGAPVLLRSRVTPFVYRSLLRDPPMFRESLSESFGWGLGTLVESRPAAGRAHRAILHGEAIVALHEQERHRGFTALGLGAAALLELPGASVAPGAGPRVTLSHRSAPFGHSANALRLEADYLPAVLLAHGAKLDHQAQVSVGLDLLFGPPDGLAVLAQPRVRLEYDKAPGEPGRASLTALVTLEII